MSIIFYLLIIILVSVLVAAGATRALKRDWRFLAVFLLPIAVCAEEQYLPPDMALVLNQAIDSREISHERAQVCVDAFNNQTPNFLRRLFPPKEADPAFYACFNEQKRAFAEQKTTAIASNRPVQFDCQQRYGAERDQCIHCNTQITDSNAIDSASLLSATITWKNCMGDAKVVENAALIERNRKLEEEWKQAEEDRKEQQRLASEKQAAEQKRIDAEFAATQLREQKQFEAEMRASERAKMARLEERKQRCGKDFDNLRIGMPIERVQLCVAKLKLIGQIHRLDGETVSTYEQCRRSGCLTVTGIRGELVAWSRY